MVAGEVNTEQLYIGTNHKGFFQQTGGTHSVANSMVLGGAAGGIGNYDLNGGTLRVGGLLGITHGEGRGSLRFNGEGGTLEFTGVPRIDLTDLAVGTDNTQGNASGYLNGQLGLSVTADTLRVGVQHAAAALTLDNGSYTLGSVELGLDEDNVATLTFRDGHLTTDQMVVGRQHKTVASVVQQSGTVEISGLLDLGHYGSDGTAKGVYQLLGGSLTAANMVVGGSGEAYFQQTGGRATVTNSLLVGDQATASGILEVTNGTLDVSGAGASGHGSVQLGYDGIGVLVLKNTGNLITDRLSFGGPGSGVDSPEAVENNSKLQVNQLFGLNGAVTFGGTVSLGDAAAGNSDGSCTLASGTSLIVGRELNLGYDRDANFNQSGGDLTVRQSLRLANAAGVTAGYTLTDGHLTVNELLVGAHNAEVTVRATANFAQSGGTVTVNERNGMQLGAGYNATGNYALSGGTLSVDNHFVGYLGVGNFAQSGGSHQANYLGLGYFLDSQGHYTLSEGALTTTTEVVGRSGQGSFVQTGGTNLTMALAIGNTTGGTGSYDLSGGSLTVNGRIRLGHDGGSGQLNLSHDGLLIAEAIDVGPGGSLNLPTRFDPHMPTLRLNQFSDWTGNSQLGAHLQLGHPAGGGGTGQLTLVTGQELTMHGELNIGYSTAATLTQSGGHLMAHNRLSVGELNGSQGTYQLDGGLLEATADEVVGTQGQGQFNQTGGTHSSHFLYLGKEAGAVGAYALSGGTWNAATTMIGDAGTGSVTQTGGTANLDTILICGDPSSNGSYTLTGGQLNANAIFIGNAGAVFADPPGVGTFQLGGTATLVTNLLNLRYGTLDSPLSPDNLSTLRLNRLSGVGSTINLGANVQLGHAAGADSGLLNIISGQTLNLGRDLVIGYNANALCNQFDGTVNVGGELIVGDGAGSVGTYNLSSGATHAAALSAGRDGTGTIEHTSGTMTLDSDITLGLNAGSNGTYRQTGGTLDASQGWFYIGRAGAGTLSLDGTATLITDALQLGPNGTFSSPLNATNYSVLRVNALHGFGSSFSTGGSLQLGHDGGSVGGTLAVATGQALTIGRELTVGYTTPAIVSQTGGTVAVAGNVILAANSTVGLGTDYTLRGGILDARDGQVVIGQAAPATLTLRGNGLLVADELVRGSQGTLASLGDAGQYATIRVNRLVNPATNFTFYGRLQFGHDGGSGEASHTVASGQSLTVSNRLSVGYQTNANFTQIGNVTVNGYTYVAELPGSQADYAQSSGTFSGGQLWVGYEGNGSYAQSGGTNRAGGVVVGSRAGSNGAYVLTGGTVDPGALAVGYEGRGFFEQRGGIAKFPTAMTIGVMATGEGTYTLGAGSTLNAGHLDVGYWGTGTFNQLGSSLRLTRSLYLGHDVGGTGTYNLAGGTFSSDASSYVGYGGTGHFLQTGGNHQLRAPLYIGYNSGVVGSYEISGGNLYSLATLQDQIIGFSGQGTVTQSAGTSSSLRHVVLGQNSTGRGTYSLTGDALMQADRLTIGQSGQGTFTQTAGTAQFGAVAIADKSGGSGILQVRGGQFDVQNGILSLGTGGQIELGGSGQLWADRITLGAGSTFTSDPAGIANRSVLRLNQISGITDLQVGGHLQLGHAGTVGTYTVANTHSLTVGRDLALGYTTGGTFTQTGGTVAVGGDLIMGVSGSASGVYTLAGGTLKIGGALTKGSAWNTEFRQNGGTLQFTSGRQSLNLYRYTMAQTAGSAVEQTIGANAADDWHLSTLTVGANGSATVKQLGGTVAVDALVIGESTGVGNYQFAGGTLSGSDLTVRAASTAEGTFHGRGIVNLTGQLLNHGQIVADGQGTPSTLDLSTFSTVSSWINNNPSEEHGWYAMDQGQLLLPAIRLNSWNQTYNWGEAPAFMTRTADNPGIDLVNSVQLNFHNLMVDEITSAYFNISLLATDRPEIVAILPTEMQLIGLWDIHLDDNAVFSATDVSLRYDHALANTLGLDEGNLQLFHFNGSAWENVTTGIDPLNKWIYTTNRSDFSLYAVGVVPEPTALISLSIIFAFYTLGRPRR